MKNSSITLWQRMVLVALTAIVPLLGVTIYVISTSINKDISFGQQEMKGDVFQRPLEQLLDLLPQHQAAARKLANGDNDAKNQMAAIEHQIDQAFAALEEVHGKLGKDLQFTDEGLASRKREQVRLPLVLADWKTLKGATPAVAAAGEITGKLVANVRMMITHAGDTSNLILDPDLDSYYLMDVTLCALPQTQDRLSSITLQVADWLRKHETATNKIDIAVMAAMLQQSDEDRITGDAQTVLSEDKNFNDISPSLQQKLPTAIEKYTAANQAFLGLLKRVISGENLPDAAAFETAGWNARAESFALWQTSVNELDTLLATRVAAYQHKRTISYAGIGIAVALVILVVWFIVHNLNKRLHHLATTLGESSHQVASAASEISAASQSLAEGASEQAASLQETSASLEEISSMIRSNAGNTQKANELAKQARDCAEVGAKDMNDMSGAMQAIKASSDDIAKIIKTIDEIAFQTNILALNAAVEAARAGEAGMGFAVVADEVRNLAQRSAQAAKETSAKIEGAITRTAQGVDISAKVAKTLEDIVTRARQVDELVAEIASASREQSQGITQVNSAVGQMDKVTQNNASAAEQSASAAEELSTQANAMKDSIAEMLQLVNGQSEATAAHSPDFQKEKVIKPAAKLSSSLPRSNGSPRLNQPKPAPATVSSNGENHRRNEIPMEGDFKDF